MCREYLLNVWIDKRAPGLIDKFGNKYWELMFFLKAHLGGRILFRYQNHFCNTYNDWKTVHDTLSEKAGYNTAGIVLFCGYRIRICVGTEDWMLAYQKYMDITECISKWWWN